MDHAPPDKSIAIECPIFSSKCVSLPVQNPCEEEVTLEVCWLQLSVFTVCEEEVYVGCVYCM